MKSKASARLGTGAMLAALLTFPAMAQPTLDSIPGQVIAKLKAGEIPDSVAARVNGESIDSLMAIRSILIGFAPSVPIQTILAALEAQPGVEYATANFRLGLPEILQISQGFPDQQAHPYDSGVSPLSYYRQPGVQVSNLDSAQLLATGSAVTVAIIDNGIDLAHPLFGSNLAPGYDFIDNDSIPAEEFGSACGHGSFVSGLVRLVAPGARLMPLRAFDENGYSNLFSLVKALYHAVDSGADVINLSAGLSEAHPLLQEAVEHAQAYSVAVVAAVGNDSGTVDIYPAAYEQALAIGAVDGNEVRAPFSNFGLYLDLVAPGLNLYSAMAEVSDWGTWSGTSFATPWASGVAALVRSAQPTYSAAELQKILTVTARVQLLWGTVDAPDQYYGYGIIDAFSAVLSQRRGDFDMSGNIDIADLTRLIDHLYISFAPLPISTRLGDFDCSANVDIADVTTLIAWLYIDSTPLQLCR